MGEERDGVREDMQHQVELFSVGIGEPPGVKVQLLAKEAALGYLQPMWEDKDVYIKYMAPGESETDALHRSVVPIVTVEGPDGRMRIGAVVEDYKN